MLPTYLTINYFQALILKILGYAGGELAGNLLFQSKSLAIELTRSP